MTKAEFVPLSRAVGLEMLGAIYNGDEQKELLLVFEGAKVVLLETSPNTNTDDVGIADEHTQDNDLSLLLDSDRSARYLASLIGAQACLDLLETVDRTHKRYAHSFYTHLKSLFTSLL